MRRLGCSAQTAQSTKQGRRGAFSAPHRFDEPTVTVGTGPTWPVCADFAQKVNPSAQASPLCCSSASVCIGLGLRKSTPFTDSETENDGLRPCRRTAHTFKEGLRGVVWNAHRFGDARSDCADQKRWTARLRTFTQNAKSLRNRRSGIRQPPRKISGYFLKMGLYYQKPTYFRPFFFLDDGFQLLMSTVDANECTSRFIVPLKQSTA